jgi:mono/diheme cytochrome c family protein
MMTRLSKPAETLKARNAVGNALRGVPLKRQACDDAGNGTESFPYRILWVARSFALLATLLVLAIGCGRSEAPRFKLNLEGRDLSELAVLYSDEASTRETKEHRQQQIDQVVNLLYAVFGTPDEPDPFEREDPQKYPSILTEVGFNLDQLRMAAGPTWSDGEGRSHGLYREHCMHCHGISGDGAGPTAAFLMPYPRDYRQGKYKFKSTERSATPTRADLKRTVEYGIPGTAMPSFALLPEDEVDALVEYVKYLSVRGVTEDTLLTMVLQDEEIPSTREALVADIIQPIMEMWAAAEGQIIAPAAPTSTTPETLAVSIEAGRKLFQDPLRAKCYSCHGPTALGDPPDAYFDDWNKPKADLNNPELVAERYTLPTQELDPRNLRLGIFRGGRRPVDIYRRVHAGINGTPMPAAGPAAPGGQGALSPEEIWSLVNYVLSLPYERMSETGTHEPTIEKRTL